MKNTKQLTWSAIILCMLCMALAGCVPGMWGAASVPASEGSSEEAGGEESGAESGESASEPEETAAASEEPSSEPESESASAPSEPECQPNGTAGVQASVDCCSRRTRWGQSGEGWICCSGGEGCV